jgi:hypothetical protein
VVLAVGVGLVAGCWEAVVAGLAETAATAGVLADLVAASEMEVVAGYTRLAVLVEEVV